MIISSLNPCTGEAFVHNLSLTLAYHPCDTILIISPLNPCTGEAFGQ